MGQDPFLDHLHWGQTDLLPDEFPRPRRHATADRRLSGCLCRVEHGRLDRGLYFLCLDFVLRLHSLAYTLRRTAGRGQLLGRRRDDTRMETVFAAAVPQL